MSNLFQDDGEPANGLQKVCLATTAYESPDAAYTFSLQKTREAMHKAGIKTAYYLLSGNCHVDDARNSIVQEFLASDCTELVFLDADVVWEPEALIKLCQYDVDVVGGVYPYRRENSGESLPVLMFPGKVEIDKNGLVEVAGLPTGFMRIKRHVIETLAEKANKIVKGRTTMPILFERTLFEGTRLGGDLSFCKKWIQEGGSVYAAANLHLGHVAKTILYDSLAASMRRKEGSTLKYMVEQIRADNIHPRLFMEARKANGNHWGALEDVLMMCALLGKKADGPVIEAGSGLTTLALAAACKHKVYCLEHDHEWAAKARMMCAEAGVDNVEIIYAPIVDGWYDVPCLPEFALGLNDGPPRTLGSRMGFFKHFTPKTIICDDADDKGYGDALIEWANEHDYKIDFVERSALLRKN